MTNHIKTTAIYFCLAAALLLAACKKNYTDPSGPSTDQAFNSPNALTDVAVGLQNWYTNARGGLVYNTITANGLVTGELYVVNAGNTDEAQLGTGAGALQNTNGVITGMWSVCNKIIYDADKIIEATPKVVTDASYASGLIAYASVFKALAMGDMATFWEQIPDGTSVVGAETSVNFISAKDGFTRAIAVIDNALTVVSANTISTAFLNNIPRGSIDILNTLYALKARYALFAEDYSTALTAANQVSTTAKSVFAFNAVTANPIFTLATSTNNIFQPVDSAMGLPAGIQPDAADLREPFYISIGANPRYRLNGFFAANTTAIPVYLPGEMILIKAECYARQNDLVNGNTWLNNVVLKKPSEDAFGVGAGLSTPVNAGTQAELLEQIYKHRCIELFMSGLKLADMRRFGRATTERKRNYFPYPFVERNANSNTPDDPPF